MDISTEVGRLGPQPPDPAVMERQMQAIVDEVRQRGRVRAKFRLNSYTTEMHFRSKGARPTDGSPWPTEQVEKRTLNFTPVYAGADAPEEDRQFWDATPSGSIQLGVVNQEAWKHFELGKSYYLDFSPAE